MAEEWSGGASYAAIRSVEVFRERVEALIEQDLPFGFDIESSYVGDFIKDKQLLTYHPEWKIVGFSFTNSTDWARYVPLSHTTGENIDDVIECARLLWRLLQTGKCVAHNAPFELNGTSRFFRDTLWDDPIVGEEVRAADAWFPILADTQTQAHMVALYPPANVTLRDGTGRVGVGLKSLTKHVFKHDQVEFDSLFVLPNGKKAPPKDRKFDTLPVNEKHVSYACEDAIFTLALYYKHKPYIDQDDFLWRVEMALMPVLNRMEKEGIYLNWEEISRKADEVREFRDLMNEELQVEFSQRLGRPVAINFGSPVQVRSALFDPKPEGLGLVPKVFTKTDLAATGVKALRVVAKSDPMINKLLLYREVAKLYSSYLDKYRSQLHYDTTTDRAHPNHKQVGALTGRMAVDRVSYQQWPKPYHYELADGRTFDLNFRDLLISPPGTRVVGYDYSQVELRVLAGLANETAMLAAFNSGVDIHKATAATMMKIPVESVTKKQRAVGKTLNFAVVYGSGAGNIAEMLTTPDAPVTKEDAEGYLRDYFAGFPRLRAWMDMMQANGHQSYEVHTPFGRKYHLWELESPNAYIRSKADRMAVNAPVQGGAADYMKWAMVRADAAIRKHGMQNKIRLVMTIHDALEFYVDEDVPTQQVIDILNPAVSYRAAVRRGGKVHDFIPNAPEIRADWHEGYTWGSVAEVKLDAKKQIVGYQIEDDDRMWPSFQALQDYLKAEQLRIERTMEAKDIDDVLRSDDDDSDELASGVGPAEARTRLVPDSGPRIEPTDEQVEQDFAAITRQIEEVEPVLTVHLKLRAAPDVLQWQRFMAWRAEHPGKNTIVVHMNEGQKALSETYGISHKNSAELALMFPGSDVIVENASLEL